MTCERADCSRDGADSPRPPWLHGDLLAWDPCLPPAAQWQRAICKVRGLLSSGAAPPALAAWHVGRLCAQVKADSTVYSFERRLTQRDVARALDLSSAKVAEAARLYRAYSIEEMKTLAGMPTTVLAEAASIPSAARSKLLGELVGPNGRARMAVTQMREVVKTARWTHELGAASSQPKREAETAPPVAALRRRAMQFIASVRALRGVLRTNGYVLSADDHDTVLGVADSVELVVGELREVLDASTKGADRDAAE